jgi:hypothetical protein
MAEGRWLQLPRSGDTIEIPPHVHFSGRLRLDSWPPDELGAAFGTAPVTRTVSLLVAGRVAARAVCARGAREVRLFDAGDAAGDVLPSWAMRWIDVEPARFDIWPEAWVPADDGWRGRWDRRGAARTAAFADSDLPAYDRAARPLSDDFQLAQAGFYQPKEGAPAPVAAERGAPAILWGCRGWSMVRSSMSRMEKPRRWPMAALCRHGLQTALRTRARQTRTHLPRGRWRPLAVPGSGRRITRLANAVGDPSGWFGWWIDGQ